MGDCRIRILLASNLLPEDNNSTFSKDEKSSRWVEILNKLFSSDSTVREVCEDSTCKIPLLPLLEQTKELASSEPSKICLWDCVLHPPKDITDWPLDQFCDTQGLRTKTLFDAGWFPSGTLRVSRRSDGIPLASSASLQNDDAQYNLRTSISTDNNNTQQTVQLAGTLASTTSSVTSNGATILPSQLLHSVTQRFDHDETMAESSTDALQQRRKNKKDRQEKEQERSRKLDARIKRLDSNSKKKNNKPVSDQVRKMLIKSRATGAKTLKQQDRVYFHLVMDYGGNDDSDDGGDDEEEFRYFSVQDTIGRGILSNFSNQRNSAGSDAQAELLVRQTQSTSDTEAVVYRSLPNSMRVYEAIEQGFLDKEINNVVIRWYSPSKDEPTTSVLDGTTMKATTDAMDVDDPSPAVEKKADSPVTTSQTKDDAPAATTSPTEEGTLEDPDLATYLQQMEEEEQKKSKKKSSKSSTSTKVRQMLMKSKAKGDAKRIKKMEERFFFELVTVRKGSSSNSCEFGFCFLGNKDPLGRLLRDCVKLPIPIASTGSELLVPSTETHGTFLRLSNLEMTCDEAAKANLLQPFGRIVLRILD